MLRRSRLLALVALAIIATALPAKACSCFQGDPRDMFNQADGAFIGTLLSQTPVPEDPYSAIYTFRVEETFKGDFPDTVEVNSASNGAACGLEVPIGQQTGLFLRMVEGQWHSSLCEQIAPDELRDAAGPLPEPDGEGPIRMMASGSYGEAGIVALDALGRTLSYGEREPASGELTVCPGSQRFLEFFTEEGNRRSPRIAVRETATMEVVREIVLPLGSKPYRDVFFADFACGNEQASLIFIAGRSDDGTGYVLKARFERIRGIFKAPVGMLDFVGTDLYVTEGERGRFLVKLDLKRGERDGIATVSRHASQADVSPNGKRIVLSGGGARGKLEVVNTATGTSRVKRLGEGFAGEALWLSDRRIGYFAGGGSNTQIEIFTRGLERVRRVPGDWYANDNVVMGDVAWGLGWGVLYRAELPGGQAEVVRRFSPTMMSLVSLDDEVSPTGTS